MNAALNLYSEVQGDFSHRNNLILSSHAMVKRIAIHLKMRIPAILDVDELTQVGLLGLIEAAEAFDPDKGVEFECFAHSRVRGAMLDEVRRLSSMPRSAVAFNREVNNASQQLVHKYGRHPTQGEIANHLGKSLKEFNHEQSQAHLHQTCYMEDVSDEVLSVATSSDTSPDQIIESNQIKEALRKSISELPERERLVLSLYYVDELNLKEIAKVIDVGESRVSQILSTTTKKLRNKIGLSTA